MRGIATASVSLAVGVWFAAWAVTSGPRSAEAGAPPPTSTPTPSATASPAAAAIVRIDPATQTASTGESVNVDIYVDGATNLGAFQLKLSFDPDLLELQDVIPGPFLGATGRQPSCFQPGVTALEEDATPQPPVPGEAGLNCITYGPGDLAGPSGSGLLATVRLNALAPGTSALDLYDVILTSPPGNTQAPSQSVDGTAIIEAGPTPTATPPSGVVVGVNVAATGAGDGAPGPGPGGNGFSGHSRDRVLFAVALGVAGVATAAQAFALRRRIRLPRSPMRSAYQHPITDRPGARRSDVRGASEATGAPALSLRLLAPAAVALVIACFIAPRLTEGQEPPPLTSAGAATPGVASIFFNPVASTLAIGGDPLTLDEVVAGVPYDPGLGSFWLDIEFDPDIVSITIAEGPFLGSTGNTTACDLTVVTSDNIVYTCESNGPNMGPFGLGVLAQLQLVPAPDLFIIPNDDNGALTVVDNVQGGTLLRDTEDTVIPLLQLLDALVLVYALEGDINFDCEVNILDEQTMAVHFGAVFGSLLYDVLYDLEPSPTGDLDIDIKDLQFVFARDGDNCETPQPTPETTATPIIPTVEIATRTPVQPTPRVVKEPEGEGENADQSVPKANLWLCDDNDGPGPACSGAGEGSLRVVERAYGVADGLGAYEFTIEYDHFVIASVNPCDLVFGPTGAGPSRGPVDEIDSSVPNPDCTPDPGGAGNGTCALSIILEHLVHFGCVTSGQAAGPTGDFDLASILLIPHPDVRNDLFPGNNNGVVTVVKDNGCELVDISGHAVTGSINGGLAPLCGDLALTVRILEGDLDLDCDVDVTDEQLIAFRYGGFFGGLVYAKWYDIEPEFHDLDIDIKDVQKVFGRDGSTCQAPIPAQPPISPAAPFGG